MSNELEVACALVKEAGLLALSLQNTDLNVTKKNGDEPVTNADLRCSQLIVDGLHRAFPNDLIVSEESYNINDNVTQGRVWFVDPIDGTKSFIQGKPGFSSIIGLNIDQKPTIGAVYYPKEDTLFYADNHNAWIQSKTTKPQIIKVSSQQTLSEIRIVSSSSHDRGFSRKLQTHLGTDQHTTIGSIGLKVALIAQGIQELYINPTSRAKTWDVCGSEAIITAAGGMITGLDGSPMCYDSPAREQTKGLIVSNGNIHEDVRQRVLELRHASLNNL